MIKAIRMFIQYAPIVFVVILVIFDTAIPNSYWFEVARIHVMDSIVGIPPKITVARDVVRPFRGKWIVTVKKAQDEAETSAYYKECVASGESDYRPETVLPQNLDLNWWTFPVHCDLQPGTYIVDTSWKFHVMFLDRTVRVVSNVFVIK